MSKHIWRKVSAGPWDDGHDHKCTACGKYWDFTPYSFGPDEEEECPASPLARKQAEETQALNLKHEEEVREMKERQATERKVDEAQTLLQDMGYKVSHE